MCQLKVFVVVLVLLACLSPTVTAKKRKSKRNTTVVKFNVDLAEDKQARVQVKEKNDVYTFRSKGDSLEEFDIKSKTLIYDYSGDNQVMVVATGKRKNSMCFYMETSVSQSDFNDTLFEQKDENVTFSSTTSLDGRGEAMSTSDARAWRNALPSVKRLCRRSQVIQLTALDPSADLTSTETKKFLGVDSLIEIVTEEASNDDEGDDGSDDKKKKNKKNKKKGKKSTMKNKGKNKKKGGNDDDDGDGDSDGSVVEVVVGSVSD